MVVQSMKTNFVSKGIYDQDIDVSNLASGIYQLSIQSGGETSVKKLSVVH
jgi:YbbR domain-containing protein